MLFLYTLSLEKGRFCSYPTKDILSHENDSDNEQRSNEQRSGGNNLSEKKSKIRVWLPFTSKCDRVSFREMYKPYG